MALAKEISYDHSITESGVIQVRRITRIMEDGEEISRIYHRSTLNPGDDFSDKDDVTKKIANVVHTKTMIDAYKKKYGRSSSWLNQ